MPRKGQTQLVWTEEMRERLTKLWSQRPLLSDSQIAEIMGARFTRHMVNSQAHRLGLPSRRSERHRQWQAARKVKAKVDWREKGNPQQPSQKYLRGSQWKALPGSYPVTIEEVDGCRWPIGEDAPFTFCDRPIERGHYCAEHHRMSVTTEVELRVEEVA
jgi:hypothetical protein